MRKRWALLCGAGLLLAGLAVGLALAVRQPSEGPVSQASAARIQPDMTAAQVEEIFGGPPGDYRTGSRRMKIAIGLASPPGTELKQWQGDDGLALVTFDQADGRVLRASFVNNPWDEMSFTRRLLALFGL